MKSILKITIGSFLLGVFSVTAQVSEACKTDASLGFESAKVKNYVEAEPYLQKVRKQCPTYSLGTFQYLDKIYKAKLKNAVVDSDKKAIVQKLIGIATDRKKYFPAKTPDGQFHSDIAVLMYENKIGTKDAQYEKFELAYKDKTNFKGSKKTYLFFSLLVDLQKAGKKNVQDVFNLYDELSDKIEVEQNKAAHKISKFEEKQDAGESLLSKEKKILKYSELELKSYAKVKGALNKKLGKLADCPNLIPLYTGQFEANKNNLVWVKQAARRLYKKECTDDPLFLKIVEKQHELAPSGLTAKYLAKLEGQKGNKAAELKYLEEAAQLESNPNRKAEVYYQIASNLKKKGSFGKARSYYNKALNAKPSLGVAYLQIANMMASSANSCGSDEFNKRAVYWLAAKYARKAGRVDPSVSSNAKKTEVSFIGRAPSKTDIFQKGMQGKTIRVGCWIGESVKVPSL